LQPGDQHQRNYAAAGLGSLLAPLGRERWTLLVRGYAECGNEGVMARAEREGLPYLFRLRVTANVKRALERAMAERDWSDAGHGWQGKETKLRLMGWSLQRRVVLLRRQFDRPLALLDRTDPGQPLLGFAEVLGGKREVWEYAALVTSLDSEILTLGQLYRDRADCENAFDELKNHWGWGGFTTQDLKRCRVLAANVALSYNWWSLFVRLADPDHHREVITSRRYCCRRCPQTQHAGRTTLSVSSTHGEQQMARRAYLRIARFFAGLRAKAEQLDAVQRWYRILSEALRKYLRGRQLIPPARLQPG
jgi:hypothetical protein